MLARCMGGEGYFLMDAFSVWSVGVLLRCGGILRGDWMPECFHCKQRLASHELKDAEP